MPKQSDKPIDDKPIDTTLSAAKQKGIKDFFVAKGHKKTDLDKLDLTDEKKAKATILTLHKMTEAEYQNGSVG